ncbi:hypothetical protein [Lunatibacter salilacus]|uniref:hypothetical protein n=1 Tax=Lunatibacter salilacus TaxID=2483804 RepID=UPI00131B8C48|nr:hypothetical protein [Lunatibacter salilacus]
MSICDKCGGRPEDTGHTASGVKLAEPVPLGGKRCTGHFKEQVNSTPLCKIERGSRLSGNPDGKSGQVVEEV